MSVLRAALQEMACHYRPDIVGGLPEVMDAAPIRAGGPFTSFEESLRGFARANYALRLQGGRCTTNEGAACKGRHDDPDSLYTDPPLAAELRYDGSELGDEGTIAASHDTDLIEVYLDPSLQGGRVTVTLHGTEARFALQVGEVNGNGADREAARLDAKLGDVGGRSHALTAQPANAQSGEDGIHRFTLSHVDPGKCDRLALIATRLDADEHLDPVGGYRINIASTAEAE